MKRLLFAILLVLPVSAWAISTATLTKEFSDGEVIYASEVTTNDNDPINWINNQLLQGNTYVTIVSGDSIVVQGEGHFDSLLVTGRTDHSGTLSVTGLFTVSDSASVDSLTVESLFSQPAGARTDLEYATIDTLAAAAVVTADHTFNDDVKVTLGTGGDADFYYNNTDVVLNTAVVGAGDFVITGGSAEFDDSEGVRLGGGKDASLVYNGSHTVLSLRDVGTGNLLVNDGQLIIGDGTTTSAANMTIGARIDQRANDDNAFEISSSDVSGNSGGSTWGFDSTGDDVYIAIRKTTATLGGARISVFAEDDAIASPLYIPIYGGTANTTKTAAGAVGLVRIDTAEHDGAGSLANITEDGNVFSVHARVSGTTVCRILVDEDGDFYSVTAAQTFDDQWPDIAILNAYDEWRNQGMIPAGPQFDRLHTLNLVGEDGSMTNMGMMQSVLIGTVRENAGRAALLEDRMLAVENANIALRNENATLKAQYESLRRATNFRIASN